jgi:hypothetical protein
MARKTFKKPLSKVPDLTKAEWTIVGDKSSNEMRDQITNKKFFKGVPYTAEYRKRKQARKAGKKGQSISSTSGVPDLTLTGKMMQALRTTKASLKGASIGWVGAMAEIVRGNAKNGRDVRDSKLLNEVGRVSRKHVERAINRNIAGTNGRIVLPVKIKL